MIELAMVICFTLMGIYFIKSTDLPKDLQERSAQMKKYSTPHEISSFSAKKMAFPKTVSVNSKQKNEIDIEKLNQEIDQLTMVITKLEQELKVNNKRNHEIQKLIDSHFIDLKNLQEKISTLA